MRLIVLEKKCSYNQKKKNKVEKFEDNYIISFD